LNVERNNRTVPVIKKPSAIISIYSTGAKILQTLIFNPFSSKNDRLTSTSIFASRKNPTGTGGRPIICCFLIIALLITAVIRNINNKEIIKTIVEIISLQY
jgi:hypothetical protein